MATEAFAQLVRSNYILSAFRQELDGAFPQFVKWWLARAFNGAILRNDKTSLSLLFHAPRKLEAEGFQAELSTMIVCGLVDSDCEQPLSEDEFHRIVRAADSQFDVLYPNTAPKDIRFVHGIFQHGAPFGPHLDSFIQALEDAVAIPLSGISTVGSVLDVSAHRDGYATATDSIKEPLIETELCVELPEAMDETAVVEGLRISFPNIQSPICGRGAILGNVESTQVPSITWGIITGRHF